MTILRPGANYVLDFETKGIQGDFLCAAIANFDSDTVEQFTDAAAFCRRMRAIAEAAPAIAGSTIWAHNVSYEWLYCKKLGIDVEQFTWGCSQILAHCVDKENKAQNTTLEFLGKKYNKEHYKDSFEPSIPWEEFNPLCPDWLLMLEYNVKDVLTTKELVTQLWEAVGLGIQTKPSVLPRYKARMQEKLYDYFWNIRMPFFQVLAIAKQRGLTMDTNAVLTIISDIDKLTKDSPKYLLPQIVKGKPVATAYKKQPYKNKGNVSKYMDAEGLVTASNPELVWDFCPVEWQQLDSNTKASVVWYFLQNGYGKYVNKVGNIVTAKIPSDSTDQTLRSFYVATTLSTIRSYMESYLKHANYQFADKDKFTVHSRLDINGTQTGRLSSSSPNIQNISGSKSSKVPEIQAIYNNIRSIVVAREGYTFISADIDRAELMILGKILEPWDTGLRDALNAGADIHAYNAEKWGLSRLDAKRVIFSLIYGATEHKIAEICECSVKRAKKILTQVHEGMPALGKALNKYIEQCQTLGGVYDLFGDFKSYPEIYAAEEWVRSRTIRQLFNAVIQGTNASLISWLLPQVNKVCSGYLSFVVGIVHDEILMEVHCTYKNVILDELQKLTCNKLDVPGLENCLFNANWKEGASWKLTK